MLVDLRDSVENDKRERTNAEEVARKCRKDREGGGGGEVRKKEKKASETRKNRLFGI